MFKPGRQIEATKDDLLGHDMFPQCFVIKDLYLI